MPPTNPPPRVRPDLRRVLAVAVMASLLVSGCAYFNTFYHAKKFYGEAEKAQKTEQGKGAQGAGGASSGLYKKAIEKCEKVIESYPGSKWQDDAYLLLAKSHYGRGDYLAAQQAVGTLLAAFPQSDLRAEGIHWQGRIQFANENYAEARSTWNGLLEEFPKFDDREEVEYFLARSTWLEDDPAGAIPRYESYLGHYPKGEYSADARLDLGELLVEEARFPDAEAVFTTVWREGKSEEDRIEGRIRLGEVLELEGRNEDAQELYARLEVDLDPEILKGRMSVDERRELEEAERAALAAALADSLSRRELDDPMNPGALDPGSPQSQASLAAAGLAPQYPQSAAGLNRRDVNDPRQQQLARVMLREGSVLAKLDRAQEAVLVYEQVVSEFPQSPFAAEAQYRLGYTYEVNLEDFDRAQAAYEGVARHGNSSFREDAQRRSKNLVTLRGLMQSASMDSLSQAEAAAAESRFMRAELYLFQQENTDKAVEEYRQIETAFAGTEHAAKAGLALAWISQHTLADSAGAMDKYAAVAREYPNTEYGRRASVLAFGPEPEPEPIDFAGPSVEELTTPENLERAQALLAEAGADSSAAPGGLPAGPPGGTTIVPVEGQLAESGPPPDPGSDPSAVGPPPAPDAAAGGALGVAEAAGAGASGAAAGAAGVTGAGGAAGAAGAAGASLGELVEASRRNAEAAGPAGSDVGIAEQSNSAEAAGPAGSDVGIAEQSGESPASVPGDTPEAVAAGVGTSAPVGPPAPPDSTSRAVPIPEDLYLNPLAVPADGPSPVAAPPAPRREPARRPAPASSTKTEGETGKQEAAAARAESERSSDTQKQAAPVSKSEDASESKSQDSPESKSQDEPAQKDGDASQDAPPDSTSGKGSS